MLIYYLLIHICLLLYASTLSEFPTWWKIHRSDQISVNICGVNRVKMKKTPKQSKKTESKTIKTSLICDITVVMVLNVKCDIISNIKRCYFFYADALLGRLCGLSSPVVGSHSVGRFTSRWFCRVCLGTGEFLRLQWGHPPKILPPSGG